jgi:hypothetical protein
MWTALQHSGWVTTLATSRWLYGLVSVVHYSAVFFCVGVIVLLDLRILGVANRHQPVSVCAGQLRSWTWTGLGIAAISGFLLFTVEAGEFAAVTPFRLKIVVIVLAFLSALTIEGSLPTWERAPGVPVTAKVVAMISLLLWLAAILVSVEIPALTGLG